MNIKDKKTQRNIIIILVLVLLIFIWNKNKKANAITVDCSKSTCGGFDVTEIAGCPSGCICGDGDPNIPDAPRKCVPVSR